MADNVKELMEEKDFKKQQLTDQNIESYVSHNSDLVVSLDNCKRTIAVADFRTMQFMKFDSDFVELLHNLCNVKGWI